MRVTISQPEGQKINLIKEVRRATGCGLKEAKDAVEIGFNIHDDINSRRLFFDALNKLLRNCAEKGLSVDYRITQGVASGLFFLPITSEFDPANGYADTPAAVTPTFDATSALDHIAAQNSKLLDMVDTLQKLAKKSDDRLEFIESTYHSGEGAF
jgi:hypothetical protein